MTRRYRLTLIHTSLIRNKEAIETRIDAYMKETVPAIEMYNDKLIKIDGEPTIEEVENNISDFEKAVARAEQLSKAARHAAEASTKVAMEGTRHAENAYLKRN